jgi:hypothetical protein
VGDDVSVDSESLLVTDFINLKIKSTLSFRYAHKDRMCICVFIWINDHTYISIYIYTIFLKKTSRTNARTLNLADDYSIRKRSVSGSG